MSKFEQIGINYQYLARNVEEATLSFQYSCNCCTRLPRCMYNDCNYCAIQQVHYQIVALFNEETHKEEK